MANQAARRSTQRRPVPDARSTTRPTHAAIPIVAAGAELSGRAKDARSPMSAPVVPPTIPSTATLRRDGRMMPGGRGQCEAGHFNVSHRTPSGGAVGARRPTYQRAARVPEDAAPETVVFSIG